MVEQVIGELPGLAAQIVRVPFVALRVFGETLAWAAGIGRTVPERLPDHAALSELADADSGLLEIPDVGADRRIGANSADPRGSAIRFFVSAPVLSEATRVIGSLVLIDRLPRQLDPEQRAALLGIARQAAAQCSLLEELMFARALATSAPVALYHSDMSGNVTYTNEEYRRIFRLKEDHTASDWSQGVHPEDRARMEADWAEFCRNPRPVRFEYRTEPTAGSVRFFAEQVVAARGMPGFIGTISDFTDLVAARSDLQQNQTLLESVIVNLPIALLACDADGVVTHHNQAAADLFGSTSTDAFRATAEILLPDRVTRVRDEALPLALALSGESIRDLELLVKAPDGVLRHIVAQARPLTGINGAVLGAVLVAQDVTERKLAEVELERVHKQLMTASRQAGMAEIATNVLHNVGNVLNSVNVSASLLLDRIAGSKPTGLARVVELLQSRGADLAQFITEDERGRHLPNYLAQLAAQLEADKRIALEELKSLRGNIEHIKETVTMQQSYAKLCGVTETVAVAALIDDSLRMNAGALARHGITVQLDIEDLPPITVDKHRALQILVNLIRNAKHACEDSNRSDRRISIHARADGDRVTIAVADNGVGIAAEHLPRLFSHGFTTRPSGHGFGLHSGALTARELGGSLRASSAGSGCGSTFTLELPRTASGS
jgi:PAS domain S-box-containing protein